MDRRTLTLVALALGTSACSGDAATKGTTSAAPTDGDDDDTPPTTETTTTTGDDDDDTTTGDDDDDDDDTASVETADTGGGGGLPAAYFDPYFVLFGGQMTFDEATGTVTSLGTAYGDIPPTIDVTFGHAQWQNFGFDPAATDYYCTLSMDLTGGVADPAWALAEPYVWYGIEYAGGPIYTDCTAADGMQLDPAIWGTPQDIADNGPWGMGVGDLSTEMAGWLSTYNYTQYLTDPTFMGGALQVFPFLGDVERYTFGYAYEVDANLDIVYDTSGLLVPIDKTTLRTFDTADSGGTGLVSAWYWVQGLWIYVI